MNEQRLEQLRGAIENGTYHVPAELVAEAMLAWLRPLGPTNRRELEIRGAPDRGVDPEPRALP